ncbi:MAG: hypothetical protein EOP38_02360 [Rubrivivax sp.]|nr:MAG: hypothetical protein EOP38_02360 [Rubrivivax sp.]
MAQRQQPSVVVQEMNCAPCMLCIYQPEHPPSIEAMGYWGQKGVFSLAGELRVEGDEAPHRLWRTPPRWPVPCCDEEDLKILEMVDPAQFGAAESSPGPRTR